MSLKPTAARSVVHSLTPLALAAALMATAPAQAATRNWLCSVSYWDVASCWSGSVVPVTGDQAYVTSTGASFRVLADVFTGTRYASLLEMDATGGGAVSLEITGGALLIDNVVVGRIGTASVSHAGGTISTSQLRLGQEVGAGGSYVLSGTSTLNTGMSLVGTGGSGSFDQPGGTHITSALYLAYGNAALDPSAMGRYTMTGGTLSVNTELSTVVGTGYFTQVDGATTLQTGLRMSIHASSRGHYLLSGGTLSNAGGIASGAGQADFVQTGGTHTVTGAIALGADHRYELSGGTLSAASLQLPGGSFALRGGSFSTGSIGNDATQGSFALNGGSLSVTGDVRVGSLSIASGQSFVQGAGRALTATSLVNAGSLTQQGTVSLLGASSNEGSWTLAGTPIDTQGTLTNAGLLSGYGRIGGNGAFVNTGLVQHSGGALELASTGANLNSGNWDLAAGGPLRLTGSVLGNQGTLNLNGGAVTGNGTLNNLAGGTVNGRGSINTAFSNAGRVVVAGGSTTMAQAFASSGSIVLADAAASLAGGAIANSGRIEGQGQVGNAIANTGSIEAKGGTLQLNGALTNSGRLRSGSGSELLLAAGLAINAGTVELAGGSVDNNGQALVNAAAGRITGHGTLRAGSIANLGQLQLSGGSSDLHGGFVNETGAATLLSGNSNTSFHGAAEFKPGSELRVSAGSVATFFGAVQQRSGASFTGTGSKFFEGGLGIGNSPGAASDAGSVGFGEGNVYLAEIGGTAPGSGFDRYSVAGTLTFGGTLTLVSWAGFVGQAGQSFDLFDWGSSSGRFDHIDASGLLLAGGTQLDTSRLYVDGVVAIAAVPEPATWLMGLAGLGLLALRGRRRRSV